MKNFLLNRLAIIGVTLVLVSCAGVKIVNVSKTYPARDVACNIELLQVKPKRKFEQIGTIHIKAKPSKIHKQMAKIKSAVCGMGGDGIIVGTGRTGQRFNLLSWTGTSANDIGMVPVFRYLE